jgi:hypothetical protein
MASAAFTCVVKQSGTAVALTTEAMTLSGGSTIAQITNTAKRVLDPDTALSVIDNGVALADTAVTIDYLFGTVTKTAGGTFTGPVTLTGAYLPMFAEAEVRSFEINASADMLDVTVMASTTAEHARMSGLKEASGTVGGLDPMTTDLDSGGTTIVPLTDHQAGTRRVLEVTFPSGMIFRAFAKFEAIKVSAAVDGLVEGSLSWKSHAVTGVDQTEGSSFGLGT